ncbi:hypothetical protein J4461_00945 [Candidatus Pacearchaeota archaeon]|nr:hypothetical protein [Candidatus Pacearchaeota archaeon]
MKTSSSLSLRMKRINKFMRLQRNKFESNEYPYMDYSEASKIFSSMTRANYYLDNMMSQLRQGNLNFTDHHYANMEIQFLRDVHGKLPPRILLGMYRTLNQKIEKVEKQNKWISHTTEIMPLSLQEQMEAVA